MEAFWTRIDTLSRPMLTSVIPLYHRGHGSVPDLVGSSVLLRIGWQSFLISAAHVLDEGKSDLLLADGGGENFVKLDGRWLTTDAPTTGRRDDKIDVAIYPLSAEQVAGLGSSVYLGLDDVAPSEVVDATPLTGRAAARASQPLYQRVELAPDFWTPS
jgi:hypothetical protein